jgi:hypothetical protein
VVGAEVVVVGAEVVGVVVIQSLHSVVAFVMSGWVVLENSSTVVESTIVESTVGLAVMSLMVTGLVTGFTVDTISVTAVASLDVSADTDTTVEYMEEKTVENTSVVVSSVSPDAVKSSAGVTPYPRPAFQTSNMNVECNSKRPI